MGAVERSAGVALALYFALLLSLGGSSTDVVAQGALNSTAAPLAALGVWLLVLRTPSRAAAPLLVMVLASLLLMAAYFAHLPFATWRQLPGREALAPGLSLVGLGAGSLPITLSPDRTWDALLGWLPPLATLLLALQLNGEQRRMIGAIVVLGALGSVAFAMIQKYAGFEGRLYGVIDLTSADGASGFFDNRNHQATLLAVALPFTPTLLSGLRIRRDWLGLHALVTLSVVMLLVVGALATTSRAAWGLVGLGALGAGIVTISQFPSDTVRRRWSEGLMLILALVLALAAIATFGLQPILSRFGATEEGRWPLFAEVWRAAAHFAPLGSGPGSFVEAFAMYEPDTAIGQNIANHAHNELLEIWLELGAPGLLLVAGFLIWWLGRAKYALKTAVAFGDSTALAAHIAMGLILVHCLVDYPLRTPALAGVFAISSAFVTRPQTAPGFSARNRLALLIAGLTLVVAAGFTINLTVRRTLSDHLAATAPAQALLLNPNNPYALASMAALSFTNAPQTSLQAPSWARRTLKAAPLNAPALRISALWFDGRADSAAARELMTAADLRTRRDYETELWLYADALGDRKFPEALRRADLVLRVRPDLLPVLQADFQDRLSDAEFRTGLVGELARRPAWRRSLLVGLTDHPPDFGPLRLFYADLRRSAAPPSDEEVGFLVQALVNAYEIATAQAEWRTAPAVRTSPDASLVYDGDFAKGPAPRPFGWRVADAKGVYSEFAVADGGKVLSVGHPVHERSLLTDQMLVLPAGRYRLTGELRAAAGTRRLSTLWEIRCYGGSTAPVVQVRADAEASWTRVEHDFETPVGCPGQILSITALPLDSDDEGSGLIRRVAVTSIVSRRTDPLGAR